MSSPQALISLVTILCAPVLAACDDITIKRNMAMLTGELNQMQDSQSELIARIAALTAEDDVDEQELANLRVQLSELGNRLESLGNPPYAPDLVSGPSVAYSEPEPPVEPPEECVSIFRIQTCDDFGVLHHLGPNMEWID